MVHPDKTRGRSSPTSRSQSAHQTRRQSVYRYRCGGRRTRTRSRVGRKPCRLCRPDDGRRAAMSALPVLATSRALSLSRVERRAAKEIAVTRAASSALAAREAAKIEAITETAHQPGDLLDAAHLRPWPRPGQVHGALREARAYGPELAREAAQDAQKRPQAGQIPGTRPQNGRSPVFRGFGSQSVQMAERAGFEPAMEFNPHTRLAGECLQPLGHLSLDRHASVKRARPPRPRRPIFDRSCVSEFAQAVPIVYV
jgi:hypothetical protein